MKKMLCLAGLMVIVATIVGCPLPVVPVVTDDNPVVVPGDSGTPETELCAVDFTEQLYDPASKSTIREQGDLLKRQITFINVCFNLDGDVDGSKTQRFFLPVTDGGIHTRMLVRPGSYYVWEEGIDRFGNTLFYEGQDFEVVSGVNHLYVNFWMTEGYNFKFVVPDLPGVYGQYGQATITTKDGQPIWLQYSLEYVDSQKGGGIPPQMVFSAYLPLNFDGTEMQAVLTVQDMNGEPYATELNFDLFEAVNGVMAVPYVYPEWMGNIEVEVAFRYESDQFVLAGGKYWDSIQLAIGSLPWPVDITLGTGDYDGFVLPPNASVTIMGQGADKTRIVNFNTDMPQVIFASVFGKGGGGQYMNLSSLTVYNGSGKQNLYYSDAAVFVEAGIAFSMDNCVVISESNTGVATNYAQSVVINHCVFIGSKDPVSRAVATFNEQNVTVMNSIFMNFAVALFNSNGTMRFTYNLFYGCRQPIADDTHVPTTYSTPGMIWEKNPMFLDGYRLDPTSPCIGKADDGTDIGLSIAPTNTQPTDMG